MTSPLQDDEPTSYDELLELQSGVLCRRQALAGGMPKAAWDWRLDRGD